MDNQRTAHVAPVPVPVPVSGDAADPRWWVPPLVATLLAPLLSYRAAGVADLFTGLPVFLIGGFVLPFAFILPSWFLARNRRRRQARIGLAAVACVLAAGFPVLLEGAAWTTFLVMLLTGNVHS
ncbi:hypothetical protein [Streptomyces sp. NPDC008122]|uniref:hypothetical protein n=1 Tax=Streptomyces sp. NPDC008122 TaxID=3364810 RepID=UPI0036ED0701